MIPTVGSIVHYVNYGAPTDDPAHCRAAIVTAMPPEAQQDGQATAVLNVFNPEGELTNRRSVQDEQVHQGGTWHWPEPAPGA
ncbi:hypothetical protein ACFW9D_05660 [Streptomyces sp. NPDC059524]|uniref:hypothetical protein n=1 Tax=Streptomyces sp. NPDC059524 TaxID=3346856 RepID=UPI0036AD084A